MSSDIKIMQRLSPPYSIMQKPRRRIYCHLLSVLVLGLVLGISGGPVYAARVTAPINAKIVSTVNLITLSGMRFGEISASSSPGTIVLEPGGARNSTQGATLNSAVPGGPASFEVIGNPSATYAISLPVSVTLSSSNGQSMEVTQFTSLPSETGQLDGGGRQTLFVGGTLNVNANQLFGDYAGVMAVTVEYN